MSNIQIRSLDFWFYNTSYLLHYLESIQTVQKVYTLEIKQLYPVILPARWSFVFRSVLSSQTVACVYLDWKSLLKH